MWGRAMARVHASADSPNVISKSNDGSERPALIVEGSEEEEATSKSRKVQKKIASRNKERTIDQKIQELFVGGRLYAAISSRPGQSGRADGYLLEKKELEFYLRKIQAKKSK